MSAGAFVNSRYEADYGAGTAIHPIRVQPETLLLATTGGTPQTNAPPDGAITNPISAECASSYRSLGLHPRKVRIKLTGAPPTGYEAGGTAVLPLLNKAISVGLSTGVPISYLGTDWVVIGYHPEGVK
jgi:hypothetical protein